MINTPNQSCEVSMRWLLLLMAWGVLPAAAQFASLSTTHDGSVLFFTTPLSQTGSGQPDYGKVFIVDGNGVRPLLVRNRDVYMFPPVIFLHAFTTNAYYLDNVSTAGDISQLAIEGLGECSGLTAALCGTRNYTTVYNARGEIT